MNEGRGFRWLSPLGTGVALSVGLCLTPGCDGCGKQGATPGTAANVAPEVVTEPVEPLPELSELDLDMRKVVLGRRLYHDTRLSGDGTVSCATCHSLDHGGAEPRAVSVGIGGQLGPINSPTVLNSRYNFRQFWDGRAADLREQAAGPIENPAEMGHSFVELIPQLKENATYTAAFQEAYGSEITKELVLDAIATYEESLLTPSPFDAYLRGDKGAISAEAKAGYVAFKEVGCTACHSGMLLGGQMFQRLGLLKDYFKDRGKEITPADLGRYNVTQKDDDRHMFKVPTLRNVALTAPYLHDGSAETLEEVIRIMATYQLGQDLDAAKIAQIKAFLESLTGELPPHAREPEAAEAAAPAGVTPAPVGSGHQTPQVHG